MKNESGNDLFGYRHDWGKTHRYYVCQTGGMAAWVGINSMSCINCANGNCKNTREEYKIIVKSFPYEVGNCRCKECRYFRLTKNKN